MGITGVTRIYDALVLRLYRRHLQRCGQRSERYRRCACPLYVEGTLAGEPIRKALDLTSWEAATIRIRQWETAGQIGGPTITIPSIAEAVEKFLADARGRGLKEPSLKKYRNVLHHHLLSFCDKQGLHELRHLTVDRLRELRAGWTLSARTQQKALEMLRSFFRFCEAADWIAKNPATRIKGPRVEDTPTFPHV